MPEFWQVPYPCPHSLNEIRASELDAADASVAGLSEEEIITNEDYWASIQRCYSVHPSIINLNNGGVSPAPNCCAGSRGALQ